MSHQSELIEQDIDAYLAQHEQKELLRFLTCGSVDDGKSTLIGRLLHDSKMIYEDQLQAIESASAKHGTTGEKIDLALLVDGLQAEREQGITIDVAYRYFSTARRKFIIADTPGHEQYTRNMATGASTSDLAIILIDARHGVMTQTRRHSFITSLLGIKHIVVAINKMDLVDFDQARFEEIKSEYKKLSETLGQENVYYIPMSALDGDNVVNKSERADWYQGQSLMEVLETVKIAEDHNVSDLRFPVQYVNRPHLNFRGFCGTVASGVVNVGDKVKALPSGKMSTVKEIVTYEGNLNKAFVGQAVTLTMADEIDISRGDMIVLAEEEVSLTNHIRANIVWMSEDDMQIGKQYFFKFASKVSPGAFEKIDFKIDVNTFEQSSVNSMQLNDIAVASLQLEQDVAIDPYKVNRATGAFIVVDRLTNITVGAGMIEQALSETEYSTGEFSDFELELNALVRRHFPHWDAKDLSSLLKK